MKFFWKYILFSFCFILSMPLAADEISEFILANGLKIVVKPDQRSPITIFQIWYKVGSANEQIGHTGISHMLEHLMYRRKTPLLNNVYQQMGAIGSLGNAYTRRDHTFYYHTLRNKYLPLAFALEAERMQSLDVENNAFEIEKKVIKQERLERINLDPYLPANNALYNLAFNNDGYQFPVIGLPEDLPGLTLKQAKMWHNRYYTPDNATIVVIGDVKPDKIISLAKKYFLPIKKKKQSAKRQSAKKQSAKKQSTDNSLTSDKEEHSVARLVMPESTKVGMVFLAFKVPSIKTAAPSWEAYALDVLAGWLDSGHHSRLTKSLIRDKKIAHDVFVRYSLMNRKQSLFIIEASPVHGVSLQQLETELINEIQKIKNEHISDKTLQNVKNQMIATEIFERDSMYTQAKIIGQAESVGIHWSDDAQYINRIKAVTSKQINEVIQHYFNLENAFIVIQK